jgi:DNA-binding response OmpR family regulator
MTGMVVLDGGPPRAQRLLVALADTSFVDSSVADTSFVDSSVAGTSFADSSVADTSFVDTSFVDTSFVGMMAEGLRRVGHEIVWTASTAPDTLRTTRAVHPDLLLLDEALENGGGFEVCRQLRSELARTPIILLTAHNRAEDRIRGLRMGADDCLSRTSAPEEVALRVSAVLRRSRSLSPDLFRCGGVTLDARAHRVSRDGRWVHLKPIEFQLLHCFLRHPDIDLDRATLIGQLWGHRSGADDGVLTLAVSSLRKKVDGGQTKLIHTVRGVGYRLSDPDEGRGTGSRKAPCQGISGYSAVSPPIG